MIRTAIIGYGKMGKIRENAILSNGGSVVSVIDPALGDDYYKEVFQHVDAVFICTPNYLNKKYTIEALENGKHVFCEKPPAFNSKEMLEIQEAERHSGCKLMYGFNHRHHESVKYIKKIVSSKKYGDVLWMRGRYGKSSDESFFEDWRSKKELSGGGILIDQGIHMLDLFLHIANDFDEIHSIISNNYWKLDGIEDNAFVIMRNNETGVAASLHSTMTQWRHLFALEIFLERGYLVLNGLKTPSGSYGNEVLTMAKNRTESPVATWDSEEHIEYYTDKSWEEEVGHFFDSICNNTPITTGTSDDALKLMNIMDRIYDENLVEQKI